MALQSAIHVPPSLGGGFVQVDDPDLVAVLRALGVEVLEGCKVKKIYTAENPHHEGKPWFQFEISAASGTWQFEAPGGGNLKNYPTASLRIAYNLPGTPCDEMDDLIKQVGDEELRAKLANTLPRAYASFGRACMEQRRWVSRLLHDARDWIRGRNRKGKRYLAERNSPKQFLKDLNVI